MRSSVEGYVHQCQLDDGRRRSVGAEGRVLYLCGRAATDWAASSARHPVTPSGPSPAFLNLTHGRGIPMTPGQDREAPETVHQQSVGFPATPRGLGRTRSVVRGRFLPGNWSSQVEVSLHRVVVVGQAHMLHAEAVSDQLGALMGRMDQRNNLANAGGKRAL